MALFRDWSVLDKRQPIAHAADFFSRPAKDGSAPRNSRVATLRAPRWPLVLWPAYRAPGVRRWENTRTLRAVYEYRRGSAEAWRKRRRVNCSLYRCLWEMPFSRGHVHKKARCSTLSLAQKSFFSSSPSALWTRGCLSAQRPVVRWSAQRCSVGRSSRLRVRPVFLRSLSARVSRNARMRAPELAYTRLSTRPAASTSFLLWLLLRFSSAHRSQLSAFRGETMAGPLPARYPTLECGPSRTLED